MRSFGFVRTSRISHTRSYLVIEARNLTPQDTSGKSDPFVEIIFGELFYVRHHILRLTCPPSGKIKKTSARKNQTLNPKWDETFELYVKTFEVCISDRILSSSTSKEPLTDKLKFVGM